MRLRAVDASNQRTTIQEWDFAVKATESFAINPEAQWSPASDGRLASKYHVAETHLLPGPRLSPSELLMNPANGAFEKVVFLLSAARVGGGDTCLGGGGGGVNEKATGAGASGAGSAAPSPSVLELGNITAGSISALTDVATGEGAISIQCVGNYTAKLVVRDGAGDEVTLRDWAFQVLPRDTSIDAYVKVTCTGRQPCSLDATGWRS